MENIDRERPIVKFVQLSRERGREGKKDKCDACSYVLSCFSTFRSE